MSDTETNSMPPKPSFSAPPELSDFDDDAPLLRKESKTSRFKKIVYIVISSIVCFFLFLYFAFPYGVVKESLIASINSDMSKSGTGIYIKIGSLSPSWFTGIKAEKLEIIPSQGGASPAKFEEVEVYVNPFALILGKVSVSFDIVYSSKGSPKYFSAQANLSALDLYKVLTAKNPSLVRNTTISSFSLDIKNFPMGSIATVGLNKVNNDMKTSIDPNQQLLSKLTDGMGFQGSLSGKIDLEQTTGTGFDTMRGSGNIRFKGTKLTLDSEEMNLKGLAFNKAGFKFKLDTGTMNIDKSSEFRSPELVVGSYGTLSFPNRSRKNIEAKLNLHIEVNDKELAGILQFMPNIMECKGSGFVNGVFDAKLETSAGRFLCR